MTSDDLGTAALVMVLVGAGVAAVLALAVGWWFLRQPARQRPGIALAIGGGVAVLLLAGAVDAASELPDWAGTLFLAAAGAVVVAGVQRARRRP